MFSGYQAGLDSPICFYWQEIRAVFPDAKVMLTKRNADNWYESFKASLYQAMISPEHAPEEIWGALKMAKTIVLDHEFAGKFEDRAFAIDLYNRHNEFVEASFVNDRSNLLVFNVSDGWPPLAEFSKMDVPVTEFPRTNSRAAFQSALQ
jgi:hypothetical protein